MELGRLTLVFPPSLEDALLAVLLEHAPALPAFTVIDGEGHGGDFAQASARERVRGHLSRRVLWMVLPRADIDALLAELRRQLPAREVAWWTEAVLDIGRLA